MTELTYLYDTYLKESEGLITKIDELEGSKYVWLDKTIFYAQGGGQPSDTGTIQTSTGIFQVEKALFFEEDVYHYGKVIEGVIEVGQHAKLNINWDRRILNARYHTAGHLIEAALHKDFPQYSTVKGFCFPEGAYMEFAGDEPLNLDQQIILESRIQEIIEANYEIVFEFIEDQKHGSGKPMRVVHIKNLHSCPCGGTHLSNTGEIGSLSIRKIKRTGDTFRISYAV